MLLCATYGIVISNLHRSVPGGGGDEKKDGRVSHVGDVPLENWNDAAPPCENDGTCRAANHTTFHALNLKTIVNEGFRCDLSPFSGSYSAGRPASLGTIVVFQSNSGSQLKRFVEHHSAVLGYRSIVIIDHQVIGRYEDKITNHLLRNFGASGSDIWRCVGSFDNKQMIWTQVIEQYTNTSDFVFPLDVDEYLTVQTQGASLDRVSRHEALVWNIDDLSRALVKLEDTGMPYKTEGALIVPTDCGAVDEMLLQLDASAPPRRYAFRNRNRNVTRQDKVFMRGRDFREADIGNHHGWTHKFPGHKFPQGVFDPPKQKSDIILVHAQQNNFEEWLLHGLRGAAVRGFNLFDKGKRECEGRSVNWCKFWRDAVEASKLDPWAMKKIYTESICEKYLKTSELVRVPISL